MTRQDLISLMADVIEIKEGYHAKPGHPDFPTVPQQLCNPGNVRRWSAKHPTAYGYIDFYQWELNRTGATEPLMPRRPTRSASKAVRRQTLDKILSEMAKRPAERVRSACAEGRRVLEALIGQYIDGKYTNGKSPSLLGMFQVYAPSSDGNEPYTYAQFVGERCGLDRKTIMETPLKELISD